MPCGVTRMDIIRRNRILSLESLEGRLPLTLLVDIGQHTLLSNRTGQKIELDVVETTSDEPFVTGMNLRAQIGDGLGQIVEPKFEDVEFNGIWNTTDNTTTGGPLSQSQFAQASVVFVPGVAVRASGIIASLTIDTTDVEPGSYPLRISDTQIGSDSVFIGAGGQSIPLQSLTGSIQVVDSGWYNRANPEDTDNNQLITAADALWVVNEINASGVGPLGIRSSADPPFLDVNNDGFLTALDAAFVVNRINEMLSADAEGETDFWFVSNNSTIRTESQSESEGLETSPDLEAEIGMLAQRRSTDESLFVNSSRTWDDLDTIVDSTTADDVHQLKLEFGRDSV